MTTHLAVVRDHDCQPAPHCHHEPRWTCPDCGQTWLAAGNDAWVNDRWLSHVRVIRKGAT